MTTLAPENKAPERATTSGVGKKKPAGSGYESPDGRPTILGFTWLGAIFKPAPFMVGALIGFIVCCFLGYQTTLKNQFGDIKRFGVMVGPQASFFPTFRQLLAVVKSRVKHGETLVIVGGSSILNGVGQSNEDLWTNRLQEKLGPKYVVVNLALRSCSTFEAAYFVAEAMTMQYDKVIFVTGALPFANWHPTGMWPYAYLYWDAKYNDMLPAYPERDRAIADREKTLPDAAWTKDAYTELQLSQLLNSKLHFLELWNTVGYRYFFTSYRNATADMSFLPRKKLPNNIEAYEKFMPPDEKFAKTYFPAVCGVLYNWDEAKKQWVKNQSAWDISETTIRQNAAPCMRNRMLTLLVYQNPDMRHKYLTPTQLKRDRMAYDESQRQLSKFGIHSLQIGEDYKGEDFRDAQHFSPSGGNKMADQTAAAVREMAKQLGYEQ
ncbi:MAG: hypothetical protein U0105_25160 [Candidatus Obscuribacterales bacterium]